LSAAGATLLSSSTLTTAPTGFAPFTISHHRLLEEGRRGERRPEFEVNADSAGHARAKCLSLGPYWAPKYM
jgi:hypothetical protein